MGDRDHATVHRCAAIFLVAAGIGVSRIDDPQRISIKGTIRSCILRGV